MSKRMSDDKRLFKIVNPKTKKRYDIPMLDKDSHDYREQYIEAMRLKEEAPDSFERMMEWR